MHLENSKKNIINYSWQSAWWEQWDHAFDIYVNFKFYKLKLSRPTNIEFTIFFILAWTKNYLV